MSYMELKGLSVYRGIALFVLVALNSQLLTRNSFGSFQDSSLSVKAKGLGGAFVGVADDSSALFINPAGMTQMRSPEASFMFGKPLLGLPQVSLGEGYIALAVPVGSEAAMGLGANTFFASGFLQEYQGVLGGAYRLFPSISIGVNATYLYHTYTIGKDPLFSDDPIFRNGISKGAVGIDAGLLVSPHPDFNLGFSVRHLNRPDVGLVFEDKVPMEMRVGGQVKMSRFSISGEVLRRGYVADLDTTTTWHLGLEVPYRILSFRGGVNSNEVAAGLGLAFGFLRIDYSFGLLNELRSDNSGSHRIALS
ncbi:MAG: type IX secretion system membrane protein PorP/SprF, partial [Elusimicrobia bacterium]|nr:type IX secretion system membrane protein PorP/SprF [Elusimicrobiota bacterium]